MSGEGPAEAAAAAQGVTSSADVQPENRLAGVVCVVGSSCASRALARWLGELMVVALAGWLRLQSSAAQCRCDRVSPVRTAAAAAASARRLPHPQRGLGLRMRSDPSLLRRQEVAVVESRVETCGRWSRMRAVQCSVHRSASSDEPTESLHSTRAQSSGPSPWPSAAQHSAVQHSATKRQQHLSSPPPSTSSSARPPRKSRRTSTADCVALFLFLPFCCGALLFDPAHPFSRLRSSRTSSRTQQHVLAHSLTTPSIRWLSAR